MKAVSLFFVFLLGLLAKTSAQAPPMSLQQAIQNRLVEVAASGNGGYNGFCVSLLIKNMQTRPLQIRIDAGTLFVAEEEQLQNLLMVEERLIVLQSKENKKIDVRTMCTESSNGSPYRNAVFKTTLLDAKNPLFRLAQKLSSISYYESTAQSMVWSVANKNSIEDIYGKDTAKIKALIPLLAELTGVPAHMFNINPKSHELTFMSASIEYLSPKEMPIKLCIYDQANRLMQTSFEDYPMKDGYYQFKFGFAHYQDPARVYTAKLMSGDKVLAEKIIDKNSTYTPLRKMNRAASISYDLPDNVLANVGVYDSLDNLYAPLAKDYRLGKGFHESSFEGCRDLPLYQGFYFKIKNTADGKTIVSQKIPNTNSEAKKYDKIVKRGTLNVNLKQTYEHTRLVVVDEQEQIIWVVYEDSKLGAGAKGIPFVYQHTQGPNAKFKVRLLDEKGNILQEMCSGKCQ
ncbi:MAG: hypothetical protein EAZ57_09240 [Cytophagales bacterium]|nr:MAG: hypothetical protein EAZ67_10045 [Cytophagales bacterium]TAF59950.1 MAG: hypothetical protein EAZ57_09240 [Cytophagales bacterium]